MFGKKFFYIALALSTALAVLFSSTHVSAGSENVTKGDVQALFHTWNTGLRALQFIGNAVAAAPLEGLQRGLIQPFLSDGAHYCVEDWHVIMIAWVTGGDKSFKHQDAVADLSGITTTFILDGVTLSTTQTPIVRRVVPFIGDVDYGFAVGSIQSPEDLGVGEHILTAVFTFPDGFSESITITFFVDPSGSGVCVQ